MSKNLYTGGCHCGNISFSMRSNLDISNISPRSCDCDFCQKHGCMAVSDPDGAIEVKIEDERQLSIYKQGSDLAELFVCRLCGVNVIICFQEETGLIAALNARSFDRYAEFDTPVTVSPKKLSSEEKMSRWHDLWTSDVLIRYGNTS